MILLEAFTMWFVEKFTFLLIYKNVNEIGKKLLYLTLNVRNIWKI